MQEEQLPDTKENLKMTETEKYIEEYKTYMSKVNRKGKEELMDYVIYNTSFFVDPASSKYHNNIPNGLIKHSINVMKLTYKIYQLLKDDFGLEYKISNESIILCALHHDLVKAGSYKIDKVWWKDEDNRWQYYMGYKYNEEEEILGHGSKSLSLIQDFIELTMEEKQAILYHMGSYDGDKFESMKVFAKNKFAQILHIADNTSLVIEKITDYKK